MSDVVAPQLFDLQTGDPVNVAPEQVPAALKSGRVSFMQGTKIPVIAPDGSKGLLASEDAHGAFAQGYKYEPVADQQARFDDEAYGGMKQGALAGAEALASGMTFGGSRWLERAAGVNPEDMRGRENAHKVISTGAEIAGALAPIILSAGAAAPLEAGIEGAGLAAKAAKAGADALKFAPSNLAVSAGHAMGEVAADALG